MEENRTEHMEPVEVKDIEPIADDQREENVRDKQADAHETRPDSAEKELVPLLGKSDAEEFRSRWLDIQTDFVDDPHHSVENADELVARVINSITENFANERNSLEDQWNRGEEASTEDLRLAMKRYRSFFNRLLTLEASHVEEYR